MRHWNDPNRREEEPPSRGVELLALDDALVALSQIDPRKGRVVELRYFGGLSVEESAEVLRISPETVKRVQFDVTVLDTFDKAINLCLVLAAIGGQCIGYQLVRNAKGGRGRRLRRLGSEISGFSKAHWASVRSLV